MVRFFCFACSRHKKELDTLRQASNWACNYTVNEHQKSLALHKLSKPFSGTDGSSWSTKWQVYWNWHKPYPSLLLPLHCILKQHFKSSVIIRLTFCWCWNWKLKVLVDGAVVVDCCHSGSTLMGTLTTESLVEELVGCNRCWTLLGRRILPPDLQRIMRITLAHIKIE